MPSISNVCAFIQFGRHPCHVLNTFEEHEIYQCRGCDTAIYADFPFKLAAIFKREYRSGDELHQRTEHKRDRDRQEYAQDYREGFTGIEEIHHRQSRLIAPHLYKRYDECCAEQFEYHRYGGRRRHAQRVEYVEQYDVGYHYGHEYAYKVVKREMLRAEYTVAGYVHHAIAHSGSDKHSDRGYDDDCAEFCRFRPYGRVEKVDSIIADSDRKVEHCQHKQEDDNSQK